MSSALTEYINSLPVFTFLLTGDLHLIGKLVESKVDSVLINAVCSIETFADDESMRQLMLPLVPLGIEQTSTIYRPHIMVQTPASLALKRSYCDVLLKTKLNGQVSKPELNPMSLETEDDIQDSNPFKFRWNN